jgi:predicted Zn-dependent protease
MDELVAAEKLARTIVEGAPGNAPMRQTLADILAYQGRADEAVRESRLAVDLVAKDKFEGPAALENLAGVYTHVGRYDEAIDILERLLTTTYTDAITVIDLKRDPQWAPLREHPRFKALIPPSS